MRCLGYTRFFRHVSLVTDVWTKPCLPGMGEVAGLKVAEKVGQSKFRIL